MKKILVITLSTILVTLLCVTGVCFADTLTDYPDLGFTLSQWVGSHYFIKLSQSDVSTSASNPTLLFNNVYVHYANSRVTFGYYDEATSSFYWMNNNNRSWVSGNYLYFYMSSVSGFWCYQFNSSDIPFDTLSSGSSYTCYIGNNAITAASIQPAVVEGSSFETSPVLVGETVGFSIPAGYALVIDGPCEIVERSYYINNSWNFYKNGSLRINGAFEKSLSATYIRDGYSPDMALTFDQLVQWDAMNVNILGAASDYEAYSSDLVSVADGSCYVIGYPQLFGTGDENSRLLYTNAVDMVCGLYINYTTRPSFRFVAIESLSAYRNDGTFYTYSAFRPAIADVAGTPTEGSGGVVITPDSPLPSGGGNTGQPPVDEDSSLLGTISRFVNDIKRLLTSAVDAINTLVSQGSSFMQSVGTMFTWLPAPLVTLLIAAFTVLVVMGVLKTLWR